MGVQPENLLLMLAQHLGRRNPTAASRTNSADSSTVNLVTRPREAWQLARFRHSGASERALVFRILTIPIPCPGLVPMIMLRSRSTLHRVDEIHSPR